MTQGFVGRVGGMLVAPRATLAAVRGGGHGGVYDMLLLLVLQLVALQLPQLVRSLWFIKISYSGGVQAFFGVVAQVLLAPVLALFIGQIALGLGTRGRPRRSRNLDLAALCVMPLVCLPLLPTLVTSASGWEAAPWMKVAVLGAGIVWYLALLVLAIGVARREEAG